MNSRIVVEGHSLTGIGADGGKLNGELLWSIVHLRLENDLKPLRDGQILCGKENIGWLRWDIRVLLSPNLDVTALGHTTTVKFTCRFIEGKVKGSDFLLGRVDEFPCGEDGGEDVGEDDLSRMWIILVNSFPQPTEVNYTVKVFNGIQPSFPPTRRNSTLSYG